VLIEHILHRKGPEVETISADAPVADAVVKLHDRNIGALVVTGGQTAATSSGDAGDGGAEGAAGDAGPTDDVPAISGILSERDVVRALAEAAPDTAAALAQPVAALMSTDLATCGPRATVDELMRLMTDRRIRHVPVLDGDRLAGIVSIGDVVKSRIDELETETETLHEYLSSGR
jgi:CBS domain-containing protein